MSFGSWLNNDGLLLQYGTQKAIPDQGGDYLAYGQVRVAEVVIDLTSLTTSPQIQSQTTFFPAGLNFITERVEVFTEIASTGGTSFSVGLGYPSGSTYANITTKVLNNETPTTTSFTGSYVGVTAISNTAFVNAMLNAATNTLGDVVTLAIGAAIPAADTTYNGAYIGAQSTATTNPNYITALAAGTYTAGLVRVRIFYRGLGTISQ
jgi:hypothetical protein